MALTTVGFVWGNYNNNGGNNPAGNRNNNNPNNNTNYGFRAYSNISSDFIVYGLFTVTY